MHFCTKCGRYLPGGRFPVPPEGRSDEGAAAIPDPQPRAAHDRVCAACGVRFNDRAAGHPVRDDAPADDDTRVDLGPPYQEPLLPSRGTPPDPQARVSDLQDTTWDYGVPGGHQAWAASPAMADYEAGYQAPLLPGFTSGEHATSSHGYYSEPQPHPDPWAAPPFQPPPPGPRTGGHRRPPGQRPRGTLVAAGALLILALGGGAYALTTTLTASSGRTSAQGSPVTVPTSPAAHASALTTPPVTAPPRTTAPGTTAPPATTPAGGAPGTAPPDTESPASSPPTVTQPPPPAGTTTVTATSAARANPAEPQIARLLASYFTAINHRDYLAYVALLDPAAAARETPARFARGYGTTTDSGATLTSIADLHGGREAASVTFTSRQAPSASPDGSSCDVWSITLFLRPDAGGYLIRRPPDVYQARFRRC